MQKRVIYGLILFVSVLVIGLTSSLIIMFSIKPNPKIVAVIDSGLDFNDHDFKGNVIKGYNFVDWNHNPTDKNGHGTFIAGMIANESPHSKLLIIKALDNKGNDPFIASGLALYYVLFTHSSIVNMSFTSKHYFFENLSIRLGEMKGIIYVGASGNQGKDQLFAPSNANGVISVSAYDSANQIAAKFSDYSPNVSYVEPGVNIISDAFNNKETKMSGTSMAAAYTTGTIAYIKSQKPSINQTQIIKFLNKNSFIFNDHYPIKSFNYEKIKALFSKTAYFWVKKPAYKHSTDKIMIHYDSLNETALSVYNNGKFLTTLKPNQQEITLSLTNGINDLMFIDTNGTQVYEDYVDLTKSSG